MRISDWSSDVCSSDLILDRILDLNVGAEVRKVRIIEDRGEPAQRFIGKTRRKDCQQFVADGNRIEIAHQIGGKLTCLFRSEEHTSELPSLMRNTYAVFIRIKNNTSHKTQS